MPTRLELRRKIGIRADEIHNYISIGRARVFGTQFDLYRDAKKPDLAMAKDAMIIASWFNANRKKWDDVQMQNVDEMILDIQHGPEAYYRRLLQSELGYLDYLACKSWATREHEVPGCINVDNNIELRDKIYKVLEHKGGLRKSPEPYRRMLGILHLAFFGLAHAGGVTKSPWIDL